MVRLAAIAALVGAGVAAGATGASTTNSTGRLVGQTQISYGCPGPVGEGSPTWSPWRPFPHARFTIAKRAVTGAPVPGTTRTITSDAQGHFALRLVSGRYLVTPLPQSHTKGGTRLSVGVRLGLTTRVLVRFTGFPQMV